ncbi:hypothetical protein QOM18_25570 [Serratia marcescens]|nr:hypothetical protein [Serratia marcescens]MDK1711693.1 hypothetical protein [Serratia marcescens]
MSTSRSRYVSPLSPGLACGCVGMAVIAACTLAVDAVSGKTCRDQ